MPFSSRKVSWWTFKIRCIQKNQNIISFLSFSASFYGSGYASLPFEDAQSTTDLSFRFRTSRAESLLVLVAGRTDYCLVMLQAGAVKVSEYYVILYDLQYDDLLSRSLKWKLLTALHLLFSRWLYHLSCAFGNKLNFLNL